MLFQSNVPTLFKNIHQQLYNADTQLRKQEAAKRLNLYHDAQADALEDMLNSLFADPSKMVRIYLNITRKIINNLAQIYRVPPTREITGTEQDQAVYKDIAQASLLDLKLKQASRYTKLLKSLLIKVVWRSGHLDLDLITGNILDVETGETPEDLKTVLITDYGTTGKIEDVEYSRWTADAWQRLSYKGDVIDSAKNPYGRLPFLGVFDYCPVGSDFWIPGGDDLISQQEAINLKLVDLLHLLHWQSFGVGFIRGDVSNDFGQELTAGPGSLIELQGEKAEIGFASQNAEIRAVVEAIDQIVKFSCVSHGLSAAAVSTDVSQTSGISKFWDSQELSEMRVEDKILWSAYESKLFDLMRLVHNTHSKDKLSDSATLKVNFNDPSRPAQSPLDQAEAFHFYQQMGVMSPVDILMKRDPDIRSREEAAERLRLIKSEIAEFGTTQVNTQENN